MHLFATLYFACQPSFVPIEDAIIWNRSKEHNDIEANSGFKQTWLLRELMLGTTSRYKVTLQEASEYLQLQGMYFG